jgi:hypothetical protein
LNLSQTQGERNMYESPKLNETGKAEEVILGLFPSGSDIDGNDVFGVQEFAEENQTEPE